MKSQSNINQDVIDITQSLNVELQGKDQLIHNNFDEIKAFENKLKIWNNRLLSNHMVHVPYLRKEMPFDTRKYD